MLLTNGCVSGNLWQWRTGQGSVRVVRLGNQSGKTSVLAGILACHKDVSSKSKHTSQWCHLSAWTEKRVSRTLTNLALALPAVGPREKCVWRWERVCVDAYPVFTVTCYDRVVLRAVFFHWTINMQAMMMIMVFIMMTMLLLLLLIIIITAMMIMTMLTVMRRWQYK